MKRTQLVGNSIRIILLMLIISMSLSACTVGNDPENSFPALEVSDKHSGSGSADTQTVTDLTVEDVLLGENQNTAVCAGYARAFDLICQYAGINCA